MFISVFNTAFLLHLVQLFIYTHSVKYNCFMLDMPHYLIVPYTTFFSMNISFIYIRVFLLFLSSITHIFHKSVIHNMNILEILSIFLFLESVTSMHWITLYRHFRAFTILSVPNSNDINSSGAGDGIFRVWRSIPCLLTHWLLKSPVHQQACYWLCGIDNMYFCSKVNSICLGQNKSKIWFKIWI